jgi:hypothetical protein
LIENCIITDASGWESSASHEPESDEESESDNENSDLDRGGANKMASSKVLHRQLKQNSNTSTHKKDVASKNKNATPKPYSSAELIGFLNEVITAGNFT